MIEITGGQNIAGDIAQSFPRISSEFVLNSDPEVIVLPYMGRNFGKAALKQRKGWNMRITTGYENRKARIELVNLIDIAFVILVFFIYAASKATLRCACRLARMGG